MKSNILFFKVKSFKCFKKCNNKFEFLGNICYNIIMKFLIELIMKICKQQIEIANENAIGFSGSSVYAKNIKKYIELDMKKKRCYFHNSVDYQNHYIP